MSARSPLRPMSVVRSLAVACALIAGLSLAAPASASFKAPRALSGTNIFGWDFSSPDAIASDGADVWIANAYSSTVVELSTSTGSLVHVFAGAAYGLSYPDSVVTNGIDVWILNGSSDNPGITELSASTGALVATFGTSNLASCNPQGMASDGTNLWVTCNGANAVFEFSMATGALVQDLSSPTYEFSGPAAIAVGGGHVWVVNTRNLSSPSITELNQSDGSFVQVITGIGNGLPYGITTDATHVWMTNEGTNAVVELNESDGSIVKTLTGFRGPTGIMTTGSDLWVANGGGRTISEVDESSGTVIRSVRAAPTGRTFLLALASDGSHVWVTNGLANSVTEVNLSSGSIVGSVAGAPDGLHGPWTIFADGTDVWAGSTTSYVTDLSEATGRLRAVITIGRNPGSFIDGITRVGRYAWVLAASVGLAQIDASTDQVVKRIPATATWINLADQITSNRGRVWVASQSMHTVSVLNGSTGAPISVFNGARYGLSPRAITSDGHNVWVASHNAIAEFSGTTYRLLRLIKDAQLGLNDANELATNGKTVFVTGQDTGVIAEVSAASGAVTRRISNWDGPHTGPTGIAANAAHLWLTTSQDTVVELSVATGSTVATLDSAAGGFDLPDAIAIRSGQGWVTNNGDDSVTEFPAT